jgi:hypothetical protein
MLRAVHRLTAILFRFLPGVCHFPGIEPDRDLRKSRVAAMYEQRRLCEQRSGLGVLADRESVFASLLISLLEIYEL